MTPAVRVRAGTVLTRSLGSGSQFARFRLAPFAPVLTGDFFGGADLFGVDGVFGGGALVLPTPPVAFARALPLARGIRDISAMRRYVIAGSFTAPVFVDSATGALVFAGSSAESKVGADSSTGSLVFTGSSAEAKAGADSSAGTLTFSGSSTGAKIGGDGGTGTLIFGGSRTEAKTASDSSTGTLIFGGSVAESASFSQTRTGILIFSGSGAESAATPVTWVRIGAFVRVS